MRPAGGPRRRGAGRSRACRRGWGAPARRSVARVVGVAPLGADLQHGAQVAGDLGGPPVAVVAAHEELEVVAQGPLLVDVGRPEAHGGDLALADRARAGRDGQRDEQDAGQLGANVAGLPRLAGDGDRIDLTDRGRFQRFQRLAVHGTVFSSMPSAAKSGPRVPPDRDAQLMLDDLAGPPFGAHAADRHGQPQRVRQLAQLDADQRPGVGQQRLQLGGPHRTSPDPD